MAATPGTTFPTNTFSTSPRLVLSAASAAARPSKMLVLTSPSTERPCTLPFSLAPPCVRSTKAALGNPSCPAAQTRSSSTPATRRPTACEWWPIVSPVKTPIQATSPRCALPPTAWLANHSYTALLRLSLTGIRCGSALPAESPSPLMEASIGKMPKCASAQRALPS